MASDLRTVLFIADQSGLGSRLIYKRMFGEYALYLDTKVVAFVCDNRLFLKPTDAGRALLGSPNEAPAYPGSKNYFLLEEELESPSLLRAAFEVTEAALPLPKPKPKPKPKPRVDDAKAPVKRAKPKRAA
ncbi:TfoX/Sxy family protein [Caenimonas sp. SL110]|uniref:TfoX/Sxy family protein n=1 Tax=Caenimonas sp. SL110 TaxID=1450524 RepID=UPI000653DD46|nr:TfoX/Sxy family protein [Caenimonas sp. SL110]